jgi:signal transduction histidine kinase
MRIACHQDARARVALAIAMRLGIRQKLVLLSLGILVVFSFGFTTLHLSLSRGWVEDDLRRRAITFTREIAATIADRRELESGPLLDNQIQLIMAVRPNVRQIDVLSFEGGAGGRGGPRLVATSHATRRLPFTRRAATDVLAGQVLSQLVRDGSLRSWEIMAPVVLEGRVAGAVAAKFSLEGADELALRIALWALGLTAASIVTMGLLMSAAIHVVVTRPLQRFLDAVGRIRGGDTQATVAVTSRDELGVLARHFNEMVARIGAFNDELRARVTQATAELDRRYQEVQRLNEVLFRMQRSLSHAERLALSGRIMAEVAHEVGTPLHSVAGHLELLRKDLPAPMLDGEPGRRLAVVEAQLARVNEIIARLLDLTRRDAGTPAPVDVTRIVRDTAELVRPALAEAGLALETAAEEALPPVHGFPHQLQQVVLNLLTNAIDATPAGGLVAVSARSRLADSEVEVIVRDTGPGIPPGDLRRIFEPFFSTKPAGKGTGLGLVIAAQIARDHRGRIEVESAVGAGSTFRLVLPVRKAA